MAGVLGMAALTRGDDGEEFLESFPQKKDNWFTRLLKKPTKKKAAEDHKKTPSPEFTKKKTLQIRPETELKRRQEICLRLREIALKNDDKKLYDFVDELDQRAWTLFENQSGSMRIGQISIPERQNIYKEPAGHSSPTPTARNGHSTPAPNVFPWERPETESVRMQSGSEPELPFTPRFSPQREGEVHPFTVPFSPGGEGRVREDEPIFPQGKRP